MLSESYLLQAKAFAEILGIFRKRNGLRRDLWKQHGPAEALRNVRAKLDRAESLLTYVLEGADPEDEEIARAEVEDDLQDLVNYAVFALRCLREAPPEPAGTLNTEDGATDGK